MAIDITTSMEYQALIPKLVGLYGDKADQIINVINTYELTPQQVASDYLRADSAFKPSFNNDGSVSGWHIEAEGSVNNASNVDFTLDSNAGTATMTKVRTPVETAVNSGGKVEVSSGLTKVATGAKSTLQFVSTEVLPAVAAAGLGISLGKAIDSALYNLNPDFWDNNGMSSLNPETWNSITSDYPDGVLKRAFNAIFGLNPETGQGQMYIDQDAAAYLAMYMNESGVFARGGDATITPGQDAGAGVETASITKQTLSFTQALRPTYPDYLCTGPVQIMPNGDIYHLCTNATVKPDCNVVNVPDGTGRKLLLCFPQSITTRYYYTWIFRNGEFIGGGVFPSNEQSYTYDNKTVYYRSLTITGQAVTPASEPTKSEQSTAWLAVYGQYTEGGGIDGIDDQTGATLPDFSGCSTPEDYLLALQSQYPDLFNDAVSQSVVNGDGTTTTRTYVPVGTPSGGNTTKPTTNPTNNPSGQTQGNSGVDPNGSTTNLLNDLIKLITQIVPKPGQDTPTDTGNPDPTGTGTTPPVVPPTGQASALFAVYNPSQAALNSFGAWLWSSNFIDQVLKLFNNPMQSIIGLHKIFAAPPISGSGTIRVGYLDSGVGSNLVGGQYVTVNCGTVKVSENFGNVFDYTDTVIRLYLPFIGIVPLNTSDVMRGSVSVVYHVDVITGACLAEVKVSRDGGGGTLYQYAGDAAVRYPISSGSYMGVVSGVLGVVGGIASAVMTGGASAPLAAGAVASGIANAKTDVQHSGSFAGNAGAMGGKKPYLIIERPQTSIASGYSAYQGVGANSVKRVGAMSGYFRMTDVHVDNVARASAEELEQIRTMIERGVIQ